MQMYIVDINDSYTMGVPLLILDSIAGDFDGDVLNILYILNQEFYRYAREVLNPRNAMQISRNDGFFNNGVNHFKDSIINCNTFINLSRKNYTKAMIDKIKRAQDSYNKKGA